MNHPATSTHTHASAAAYADALTAALAHADALAAVHAAHTLTNAATLTALWHPGTDPSHDPLVAATTAARAVTWCAAALTHAAWCAVTAPVRAGEHPVRDRERVRALAVAADTAYADAYRADALAAHHAAGGATGAASGTVAADALAAAVRAVTRAADAVRRERADAAA